LKNKSEKKFDVRQNYRKLLFTFPTLSKVCFAVNSYDLCERTALTVRFGVKPHSRENIFRLILSGIINLVRGQGLNVFSKNGEKRSWCNMLKAFIPLTEGPFYFVPSTWSTFMKALVNN